jgi:hypothetical protein
MLGVSATPAGLEDAADLTTVGGIADCGGGVPTLTDRLRADLHQLFSNRSQRTSALLPSERPESGNG